MDASTSASIPMLFESMPRYADSLAPYIREVGRGKRGAKDLTREQAREAMTLILAGKATPAQIGAFFQAFRIKAETPDELAGMIEAAREFCEVAPGPPHPRRVEVGLPYDGRVRAFHVLPFAALLAARAGVQVFLHGDAGVGPKFGVNAVEILHALGFAPSPSPSEALKRRESEGVAFCLQSAYSPSLAALRPLRNEVVLRGPLATVEKMLNLTRATALIAGNTHTPYGAIMSGAFSKLIGNWDARRAWVIQGSEGHLDLDPRRRVSAMEAVAGGGDVPRHFEFDPKLWQGEKDTWLSPPPPEGIDPRRLADRRRWIEANLDWGQAALEGRESRGAPALLATTALLLLAVGVNGDLVSAAARARGLVGP